MSIEQNEPQSIQGHSGAPVASLSPSQDGAAIQNGQGQQRRRRRRRKTGKGAGAAAQADSSTMGAATQPGGTANAAPSQAQSQPQAANTPAANTQGGQPKSQGRGREHRQAAARESVAAEASVVDAGRETGREAGDEQAPRQARPQQNHQKKQQRQQAKGGAAPSQGRQFHKGGGQSQPRESNPGNGTGQPGGPRRKTNTKARRQPPSFVGPMDHSYRTANGNVADGSPSTMDFRNGNGNGNIHGRNGYSEPEAAPAVLREDAPVRIVCFIEDLFVVAKMQETARKLGVKVSFAKADKDTITRLTELSEAERPSLIVFDLNNVAAKPLTLIPKLKAKLKRGTSIIGFLSHIQGDLKGKAVEAGCDMVMPKAAFSQNLPNLLRRHGLDEEPEAGEA